MYFSDFFIGLGSPRAMAGTHRHVLAWSAGSLSHGTQKIVTDGSSLFSFETHKSGLVTWAV